MTGTGTAGLRFTDDRVHDLFQALLATRHTIDGFTAAEFRDTMAGLQSHPMTPSQTSYDLQRLREHGFITRRPHTRRYDVTPDGLEHALFLTRAQDRFLRTGLAELAEPVPNRLNTANQAYTTALNDLAQRACLTR